MTERKENPELNSEIPEEMGSWTLQQGIDINEFEKKATESLENKKKIHANLGNITNAFGDFAANRGKFIAVIILLTMLIILQFLQASKLVPDTLYINFVETIFTLLAFGFVLYRIINFLDIDKETRKKLSEMDRINGLDESGKALPQSFELVAHTFVPRIKDFMEAYGSNSAQEHIKEMLKNALALYDIYSEKIGNSMFKSAKIMYSESASLKYLIYNLNKDAELDTNLAYLAYYDYVKDPVAKNRLGSILNDKKLGKSRENLIQLLKSSIQNDVYFPWGSDFVEDILVDILNDYCSNNKIYSVMSVRTVFSERLQKAYTDFNKFLTNLEIFGIKVDLERLKSYNRKELTPRSLEDGNFFIDTLLLSKSIEQTELARAHLSLIYHYDLSESYRRRLLGQLGKEDKEIFAQFIYKNLLGIQKPISKETLGQVLSSIGDYRIEKIGKKIKSILELVDFLNTARKTMNSLGFEVSIDLDSDEYVKGIATSIMGVTEESWMTYYLDYFMNLTNWGKELVDKFPGYTDYSIQQFVTILYILFSNGRLHFQPSVDKIDLNRYYTSMQPNLEVILLKFVELFQKASINDIPKIVLEVLVNPLKEDHPYYVDLFHREFVLGSIPSYDFLVWEANRGYLEQSATISLEAMKEKKNYSMIEKIIDTIFSLELDKDFIKSMLIGGAVNAYLIFKSSNGGRLITTLKSGSKIPGSSIHLKSFASFLNYKWGQIEVSPITKEVDPSSFYRVNFSGYAVILGIVPERMTFTDFSNTMNLYINAYLDELIKEAYLFDQSNPTIRDTLQKLKEIHWEILPLDISTVRKALDERDYNSLEKEYINTIGNFLKEENIEKKLAWIGVIESRGDISADRNIHSIIRNIAERDPLGFARYFEVKPSYFDYAKEIPNIDLHTLLSEDDAKQILNKGIMEAIGSGSLLDACELINRMQNLNSKNVSLKSKLEKLTVKISNFKLKLSSYGLESMIKQLQSIANAFELLIGEYKN